MAGDPVVAWTLRIALVLFLLLFVFEHLVSERLGMRGFLAICAAMAALALWATAMTPHGLAIILLVLLAAVLGSRLAWRDLLLARSEEHTSELQSLMRISYAVFCLKKKQKTTNK